MVRGLESNNTLSATYDYNNGLLDSLTSVLNTDIKGRREWHNVYADWPVTSDAVKSFDKPTAYVKCSSGGSDYDTIGTRIVDIVSEILIVYPQLRYGSHFEPKSERLLREEAAILEQYLYNLDRRGTFTEMLENNITGYIQLLQVTDIEYRQEKISLSSSLRPVVVFQSCFLIKMEHESFSYTEFLDSI